VRAVLQDKVGPRGAAGIWVRAAHRVKSPGGGRMPCALLDSRPGAG